MKSVVVGVGTKGFEQGTQKRKTVMGRLCFCLSVPSGRDREFEIKVGNRMKERVEM